MSKKLKHISTTALLLLLMLFAGCFRGAVWGNGNRVTVERGKNFSWY